MFVHIDYNEFDPASLADGNGIKIIAEERGLPGFEDIDDQAVGKIKDEKRILIL